MTDLTVLSSDTKCTAILPRTAVALPSASLLACLCVSLLWSEALLDRLLHLAGSRLTLTGHRLPVSIAQHNKWTANPALSALSSGFRPRPSVRIPSAKKKAEKPAPPLPHDESPSPSTSSSSSSSSPPPPPPPPPPLAPQGRAQAHPPTDGVARTRAPSQGSEAPAPRAPPPPPPPPPGFRLLPRPAVTHFSRPWRWPEAQVMEMTGRSDRVWSKTRLRVGPPEYNLFAPGDVQHLNLTWLLFVGDSNLLQVLEQDLQNLFAPAEDGHRRAASPRASLECETYAASSQEYARFRLGLQKWWQDTERLCLYRYTSGAQDSRVYFRIAFRFLQQSNFTRQSRKVVVHLKQPNRMFLKDGLSEWSMPDAPGGGSSFGAGFFPAEIRQMPFMEWRNRTALYSGYDAPPRPGRPPNGSGAGGAEDGGKRAYPDVVWMAPGLWWWPVNLTEDPGFPDPCANIRWFLEALLSAPTRVRVWQSVPTVSPPAPPRNKRKSEAWERCQDDRSQWNYTQATLDRFRAVARGDGIFSVDMGGVKETTASTFCRTPGGAWSIKC